MITVILIIIISLLFYVTIPGIGALIVRNRWLRFRKRLVEISLYPLVEYADMNPKQEADALNFRFFGHLEAIQGENRIWLTNGTMSIAADLRKTLIYLVPSKTTGSGDTSVLREEFDDPLPYMEPVSIKWKQICSLPEGTKIFVAGSLFIENGLKVFKSSQDQPLLAVIYDGEMKDLLKHSIWYGRQKNEYWNQFTLASLITGFFLLLFCTYLFLRLPDMRIPALLSFSLSLLPVTLFLPPFVPIFFVYRFFWKKARLLRAERDLLRLPLRYFPDERDCNNADPVVKTRLPDNSIYVMIKNDLSSSSSFLPIHGNVLVRSSSLIMKQGSFFSKQENNPDAAAHAIVLPGDKQKVQFLFGAYINNNGNEYITEPADPMAELIQIPGNPRVLARECHLKAQFYAFFSGLCILFEILLNLGLLFFILQYLIR